jgi:hypothetical protein
MGFYAQIAQFSFGTQHASRQRRRQGGMVKKNSNGTSPFQTVIYKSKERVMGLLLFIILILLLLGSVPAWPYSRGWGYYPSGGLGLLLVVILVLAVMNRYPW